jgi:hypothetical protein
VTTHARGSRDMMKIRSAPMPCHGEALEFLLGFVSPGFRNLTPAPAAIFVDELDALHA